MTGLARYGVRCEAPWWARGGHAQTLFGHLLPCHEAWIDAQRGWTPRQVELEDGERLLVFTRAGGDGASSAGSARGTAAARAAGKASGAPRIRAHLFHGLSGDVNSEYMRRAAALFARAGHDVWAVNHRGCGEGSGLATRPYHSGRTDDMQAVLAASRADAPERRHLVVGFSLSGNIALLYAGRGLAPAADAIVAINPPVDLERASRAIHTGFNRLYEARFMHRLGQAVRERERLRAARGEPGALHPDVRLSMSLCEFDDRYTAPEAGFADGLDYYRTSSSLPHLAAIETPTAIVTAGDDPFVDPAVYAQALLPPAVHLHVEPTGGHVGYVAVAEPGRRGWTRWLDGALVHYAGELLR